MYDALGRTKTVPGTDTTSKLTAPGDLDVGYHANDMVATLSQTGTENGVSVTKAQDFTLDATGRISTIKNLTAGISLEESTNHYDNGDDSPGWTDTKTRPDSSSNWTNTWTRNIVGLGGDLVMIQPSDGGPRIQIGNLHFDIAGELVVGETAPSSYSASTEYGISREPVEGSSRYGWLGGHQRQSGGTIGGAVLMGVRLYNSSTGRFLTRDPVEGGNDNTYIYPADPLNVFDLTGEWSCSWCKKVGKWAWKHKVDIALTAASFTPVGAAAWAVRGYRVTRVLRAAMKGREIRASRHITKAAGKKFVGKGYTKHKKGGWSTRLASKDGQRHYRYPSKKSSPKYNGYYSNFQNNAGSRRQRNVHIQHRRFF